MPGLLAQTGVQDNIVNTALAASPYNTIAYGLLVLVLIIIVVQQHREKKVSNDKHEKVIETVTIKYENLFEKFLITTSILTSKVDNLTHINETLTNIKLVIRDMDVCVDDLQKIADKLERKT